MIIARRYEYKIYMTADSLVRFQSTFPRPHTSVFKAPFPVVVVVSRFPWK
jgi:hypothetical protein